MYNIYETSVTRKPCQYNTSDLTINYVIKTTNHQPNYILYRQEYCHGDEIAPMIDYSLEFASPTIFNMWRSSLNLSNTVPLMASWFSCWAPSTPKPQHSTTSGYIWLIFDKGGLPKVVHSKVWPLSKLAETNRPKWFTRPPKPMPFGMLSELKFTAHYQTMDINVGQRHNSR